jgi:hypothetical protein
MINRPFTRAAKTANATTGYTAKTAATLTRPDPAGSLVHELAVSGSGGGWVPDAILIYPFGLGSNNDAFTLKLYGWKRMKGALKDTFVPVQLADFT